MTRGRAADYRERRPPQANDVSGRAASTAQDVLLTRLKVEQGKSYRTVNQAIEDGLLTDADWCEELNRQRELLGITRYANPDNATVAIRERKRKWQAQKRARGKA